jgi:hypothetical protein
MTSERSLVEDASIIRNRGKIQATVDNARATGATGGNRSQTTPTEIVIAAPAALAAD